MLAKAATWEVPGLMMDASDADVEMQHPLHKGKALKLWHTVSISDLNVTSSIARILPVWLICRWGHSFSGMLTLTTPGRITELQQQLEELYPPILVEKRPCLCQVS